MENVRKASRADVERYDLEILLRRPSLRTNIPRRVSQVCREEISTGEARCGVGCIRGQWLQSFANRNSFTLIYGILGSFYGSYYAYFYGVISTLERRFKVSSQTTGIIAATGDAAQVIMCIILSQCVPKVHRPKWLGIGVFMIVTSTVIFTLPHFIYQPHEPKNELDKWHSTYFQNGTGTGHCNEEFESCTKNLKERKGPLILLILAQGLHGIGGSLYFVIGKSYQDDNTEKNKPPAFLSLLSVLKILGPAFGYWLSSMLLKIFEYPQLLPSIREDEPHWIGAWWLGIFIKTGSLIIGFVLIVPGFLVILYPTTLPKAVVKRIHDQIRGTTEITGSISEGKIPTLKRFFINPSITCTHFAAIFNIMGFLAYYIFLPKYVEIQYRVSASKANLIAGSVTLISSAVGIVTANSIITRNRPSARALASWTVIVGILSVGGLVSYIFLPCQANDDQINAMATQSFNSTCNCVNSSFSPVCDEYNQAFISFCHAGCENTFHTNNTQDYENCNQTVFPSRTRKVYKGFCPVDCHSNFLKFIIVTCSISFIYATGRTSIYWFETKSYEQKEKSVVPNVGMFLGLIVSIPVPVLFGFLLDKSCLLWEGNCKFSGNCWLYNNEKLRFDMNMTAIGFAVIGILFDLGIWYSAKNLELYDDIDYYIEESEEM